MQKHAAVTEEDHELRIREFAGVQHWSCGRTAMSDAACGRGLGGSYWLDQLSRFSVGVYGIRGAAAIFTISAFVELVADKLPRTPSRTAPAGLSARIVTGALTGACLGIAAGLALWPGALAGAIGGIAGGFAGYHARVGLVRMLHAPDFAIAIPEDLIAIRLGLLLVSRF
jgi:uncharacterized membrane protein